MRPGSSSKNENTASKENAAIEEDTDGYSFSARSGSYN